MSASPLLGWVQSDKARNTLIANGTRFLMSTTAVYYRTVENAGAGFIVRDYYSLPYKLLDGRGVQQCQS